MTTLVVANPNALGRMNVWDEHATIWIVESSKMLTPNN